ncbi:hypothetical protein FQA39_LY09495 [Lamprigera yunnana]|nr:hypothetical protein FQA39_LY09495 [Lamprigera yunnana]
MVTNLVSPMPQLAPIAKSDKSPPTTPEKTLPLDDLPPPPTTITVQDEKKNSPKVEFKPIMFNKRLKTDTHQSSQQLDAQTTRNTARIYRRKAENQRDPRAQHQLMRKAAPRASQRTQIRVPSVLPPPTLKSRNVDGNNSTTNPVDDTLFAKNMSVKENNPRVFLTLGAPVSIDIALQTYSELITDDANLAKAILPEYLSYYVTAM